MTGNATGKGKSNGRPTGGDRRPRRDLLAGAAAVLGVVTAETLASGAPAQATQGSPVLLGQENTGATARTALFDTGGESAVLADPVTNIGVAGQGGGNGPGVQGTGAGSGSGVVGSGAGGGAGVTGFGGGNGTGVIGNGDGFGSGVVGNAGGGDAHGVEGFGSGTGAGLVGTGGAKGPGMVGSGKGNSAGVVGIGAGSGAGVEGIGGAKGVGVLAESSAGGTALQATGRTVFSRSGVLTVAAGSSKVTKTGVTLTSASLVLATLQQDVAGVWVRSAVPDATAKSFTVHLSKAVSATVKVAWFVVN